MPVSAHFRPRQFHRHQQSPAAHRAVRREPGMQLRSRPEQGLQKLCRASQAIRCAQLCSRRRQDPYGGSRVQYQHGPPVSRIPQTVAAVPQRSERHAPPCGMQTHRHQRSCHPGMGRGPKDHRHQKIGGSRRAQQDSGVYIRVKDPIHHRYAPRHQSQRQHTSGHTAGKQGKQQRQPQQPRLPPIGGQGQQHSRRSLHRCRRQKGEPRKKYSGCIQPAQKRCRQIPSPPQRDARKPRRGEQQEIVHRSVEQEHAVQIHHRHALTPPLRFRTAHYRPGLV